MKHLLLYGLIFSLGLNVWLAIRKFHRFQTTQQTEELLFYRDISYKDGNKYFQFKLKEKYPKEFTDEKFHLVYMWDSLLYDFICQDQMRRIDSMALKMKGRKIEYVFATEMDEEYALAFQKKNYDDFKNVKQIFGMNDFISGVFNRQDLNITRPIHLGAKFTGKSKMKTKPLYILIDSNGTVLYSGGSHFNILTDSVFFRKIGNINSATSKHLLN